MREESINRLNDKIVYKFDYFLYYDDFIFMSEEDKNKEIQKDNKIINFLPLDCDKNKIYYWDHYWGFIEDYYLYTKDFCECKSFTSSERINKLDICKECVKPIIIY